MKTSGRMGLSFVIPCFNSGEFLLDAVQSLLGQSMKNPFEIIIVDDGSSQQETKRALAAAGNLSAVRVIRSKSNQGVQNARNLGMSEAQFDLIMTLDADDRLRPPGSPTDLSYPDQALAILQTDARIAFVHTMSKMFGAFDGLTISSYPCCEEMVRSKHHVPTSIVFRREDAVNGAFYNPRIKKWQDWSFAVALLDHRWRQGRPNLVGFVRGPYHEYRIHRDSGRISAQPIDEYEMTLITVEGHLQYFQDYFGSDNDAQAIASQLVATKPSRLIDLLHMAAFDLDQALTVARERKFELVSPYSGLGIP